jgi:hypothetical protein
VKVNEKYCWLFEIILNLQFNLINMARIAGLKFIKNNTGKVTHVTLSMKHHAKVVEDLIDHQQMADARNDEFIPWGEAKKDLEKIAKSKTKVRV